METSTVASTRDGQPWRLGDEETRALAHAAACRRQNVVLFGLGSAVMSAAAVGFAMQVKASPSVVVGLCALLVLVQGVTVVAAARARVRFLDDARAAGLSSQQLARRLPLIAWAPRENAEPFYLQGR